MIFHTLILFSRLFAGDFSDTLVHPLRGGVVLLAEKPVLYHEDLAATIFPTSSYTVTSCSKGKVAAVRQYPDGRWVVIVKSDSLTFSYEMDTVFVSKNERIDKGSPVGKLKQVFGKDEIAKDFPLIVFVMLRTKEVYARRYLIFEAGQSK